MTEYTRPPEIQAFIDRIKPTPEDDARFAEAIVSNWLYQGKFEFQGNPFRVGAKWVKVKDE
jgi:hypothetical protein